MLMGKIIGGNSIYILNRKPTNNVRVTIKIWPNFHVEAFK
jgi:hypothetical protein